MKRFNVIAFAAALIMALSACQNRSVQTAASTTPAPAKGQIYLYGESHGVERILNKELERWQGYYNDDGMRHLFVEYPYYTAEF